MRHSGRLAIDAEKAARVLEEWLSYLLPVDSGLRTRVTWYGKRHGKAILCNYTMDRPSDCTLDLGTFVGVVTGAAAVGEPTAFSVSLVAYNEIGYFARILSFDIDLGGSDVAEVARDIYDRAWDLGLDPLIHVMVWFSGKKGVHVDAILDLHFIASCESDYRANLAFAKFVMGNDYAVDRTQVENMVIRVPYSPHVEGGLKMPIDIDGRVIEDPSALPRREPLPSEASKQINLMAVAVPSPCARPRRVTRHGSAKRLRNGKCTKLEELKELLKEAWKLGTKYDGLHDALAFGVTGALLWRGVDPETAESLVAEVVEWAYSNGLDKRSDYRNHLNAIRQAVKCYLNKTCRTWGLPALKHRLEEIGALRDPVITKIVELLESC